MNIRSSSSCSTTAGSSCLRSAVNQESLVAIASGMEWRNGKFITHQTRIRAGRKTQFKFSHMPPGTARPREREAESKEIQFTIHPTLPEVDKHLLEIGAPRI
uniref:Uncharacterized protein n=1 Tax=Anopheles merus TaxID=30066 RepID=A0A182UMC5_ANOME